MFRRTKTTVGLTAAFAIGLQSRISSSKSHTAQCDAAKSRAFDTKGLPKELSPFFYPINAPKTTPLYLAGVGMRRKNLYIVEVDIYMCGSYVSRAALIRARKAKAIADGSTAPVSLPQALLAQDELSAAITLKFVRDVGSAAFIEAMLASFSDCKDQQAVTNFKEALSNCVGLTAKVDDEVVFFFAGDDDIAVAKNGSTPFLIGLKSKEVARRLLDVYLDPARGVSKELLGCVNENINEINVE